MVGERLRSASVRLLTLTGPGGVGKTRLALEAARAVEADFADGACLVSLAAVRRPEDVAAAVVSALGIILLAGESPSQAAKRFLAAKEVLLFADNFEHVLGAAPFVGDLVAACHSLTVLATSREPLALHAEERYPVPPLLLPRSGTPEDTETLAGDDAVTLFVERARALDPAFDLSACNAAAVAEICRRVDGLPLAIELAAARCGLLSPAEIAERLEVALGAPGAAARDAPARHHTLRATVDWSYQLLSDDEKACFERFAVFPGGATIQAAQAITDADLDTLDHLVGKSLLVRRRQTHTPTRLQMLETIRACAAERFAAAGDRDALRERHYRHFLSVAERHGTEQALMGVDREQHLIVSTKRSTILMPPLRGPLAGWTPDRRWRWSPRSARIGTCETATRTQLSGSTGRWLCRARRTTRPSRPARSWPRPSRCDGRARLRAARDPRQGSSRRPRCWRSRPVGQGAEQGLRHVGGGRSV